MAIIRSITRQMAGLQLEAWPIEGAMLPVLSISSARREQSQCLSVDRWNDCILRRYLSLVVAGGACVVRVAWW